MTQFFKHKELPLSKKVFDQLANWVEKQKSRIKSQLSEDNEAEGICNPYAVRSCLEAVWFAYGNTLTPELPCKSLYRHMMQKEMNPLNVTVPKLMFTVFNGGKALVSKVKFSRFYIILNLKVADVSVDANLLYYKISAAIKKAITSHKLGESGFKANISGSYFNALENINESFKLLEDAIVSTGVNTNERKYLLIGINADSQSSYLEEQGRYDIEGPKNLFD